MSRPLPPRAVFGPLPRLVNEEALGEALGAAGLAVDRVEIGYVRLAPGRGGVLGVTLFRGEETVPGYVRAQPGGRGRELARKWARLKPPGNALGPGFLLLPDGESVLFLWPNDARLRTLRWAAQARKRARRLAAEAPGVSPGEEAECLRWKPERRALLKLAGRAGPCLLRCFPDARGAVAFRLARALRARGLPVPAPRGSLLAGRWLVEAWVPGRELAAALGDAPLSGAQLGALLEELHRFPPPPWLPPGPSATAALRRLAAWAALDPEVEAAAAPLCRYLAGAEPRSSRVALLHGDLHLRQILWSEEGPVLVDLERSAPGPPGLDLGTLQAELELEVHEGRIPAAHAHAFWESLTQVYPPPPETAYYAARQRLALALLPLRRCEPSWRERTLTRLAWARVAAGLRGGEEQLPPCEILYPRRRGLWPGWRRRGDGSREAVLYDPALRKSVPVAPEADPALPALGRWHGRGRLVGYRPGRRATVALPGGLYAKVLPPRRLPAAAARWEALQALVAGRPEAPVVPRLLESRAAEGVLLLESLPGRPLTAYLHEKDRAARQEALAQVAAALAALHTLDPAGLPQAGEERELAHWVAAVRAVAPTAAAPYEAGLQALPVLPPPEQETPVHGDLHPGNVLLTGARVGLLDLDAAGRGHPARDAADLAAHLWLGALQRGRQDGEEEASGFLAAYLAAGGPGTHLESALARSLFRLACVHALRRPTAHLALRLLEAAAALRHA